LEGVGVAVSVGSGMFVAMSVTNAVGVLAGVTVGLIIGTGVAVEAIGFTTAEISLEKLLIPQLLLAATTK
jgi:hypothetical protein